MMAIRKSPALNATEISPFQCVFGQPMKLPFDIALVPKDNLGQATKDHIQEITKNLEIVHEIAEENHKRQKILDKQRHDHKAKIPDFKAGDLVLKAINKIPVGQSKKLYDKFEGPYRIMYKGENYTYKLYDINKKKPHQSMINACHLKHYNKPVVVRPQHENENDEQPNVVIQEPQGENQNPLVDAHSQSRHIPQIQQTPLPVRPQTQQAVQPNNNKRVQNDKVQDTQSYPFNKALRGRLKHGRREIQVEWLDGSRSWISDDNFDENSLQYINSRFTKNGKIRRSCFKHKKK